MRQCNMTSDKMRVRHCLAYKLSECIIAVIECPSIYYIYGENVVTDSTCHRMISKIQGRRQKKTRLGSLWCPSLLGRKG